MHAVDHRPPCEWDLHKVCQEIVRPLLRLRFGWIPRCPMECRLQNSPEPWKCQVLLRFEKDENGQPNQDVHEIKFGPVLTDKSQLEEMLRRAQLAVLNPSVPYSSFVNLDTSKLTPGEPPILGTQKSLQFSSNVVAFDLYVKHFVYINGNQGLCSLPSHSSGPDTADLSFIDLPGVSPVSCIDCCLDANGLMIRSYQM